MCPPSMVNGTETHSSQIVCILKYVARLLATSHVKVSGHHFAHVLVNTLHFYTIITDYYIPLYQSLDRH